MKELLESAKRAVSNDTYPGYPTHRFVMENAHEQDDLTLPDGEWSTHVTVFPPLDEQERLSQQGYELDRFGRPLHPWLRDMLADPNVGVVTGLGEYWRWGPNRTADPIIMNTDPVPKVLLIKRSDTGTWALPGGFVDRDEEGSSTARRELFEEAGLIVTGSDGQQVYKGVVADTRTTAHAWAETTALTWRVEGTPNVRPNDDAVDAAWFSLDELPDALHGSHRILIELAVDSPAPNSSHVIHAPKYAESYHAVGGGHMTYHRFVVTTNEGPDLFMKSHDHRAFTDPARESHSRQYLHKEKLLYDHLRRHGFAHIPDHTDLHDDNTLIMEALTAADDWQWRAPEAIDDYVQDAITSLDQLQTTRLPDDFYDTLLPTYDTHAAEGWLVIDKEPIEQFGKKLMAWKPSLKQNFQAIVESFIQDLPALGQQFESTPQPDEWYLCHHDLRQANMAWHPENGVKIIDWSWAGVGRKDSDTTTLLIDLHKSGHDVSMYMDRFNPDHALTLIGFWTAHSLWSTRDNDDSVRFHQAVSALSAYDLLMKYRKR